jgi:hypothetical protein
MSIHNNNINSVSYSSWYTALNTIFLNGNTIYLQLYEVGNTSRLGIWTLKGITIRAYGIDIALNPIIVGNGTLSNNATYTISWVFNGRDGFNGSSGTSGTRGTSGSSGTSGEGFNAITNPLDNRILTSIGTTTGANAESNATFNGNTLSLNKNGTIPNIILQSSDFVSSSPFFRINSPASNSSYSMGILVTDNTKLRISYNSTNTAVPGTNDRIVIDSAGDVGIGVTNPTAYLHIKAGLSTAGNAPLKFTTGTLNTTAEPGAMEYSSPLLYFTNTTGRRMEIPQVLQSVSPGDTRERTTILTNVAGLSVPLLSGKKYLIDGFLIVACVAGVGVRADLFYNGGALSAMECETIMINSTTIPARSIVTTGLIANSLVNVSATITNPTIRFTGFIQPNSSNNLTIRAAQGTGAVNTTFIAIGSYLRVTEVI